MTRLNTVVIYRDKDRRATVTGVTRRSANAKTGDMLQLTILPEQIDPITAMQTGQDTIVCDDCPLRSKPAGGNGVCYVVTGQMPNEVWKASAGRKTEPAAALPGTKPIRLGAYGDPAFLPVRLLRELTAGRRHTGYTHRWRSLGKRGASYARYLMASIDKFGGPIINQITEAKALGYRYFRVSDSPDDVRAGEVLCPNYTHGVNCADCGLCNGSTGADDKRKNVVIPVHGSSSAVYQKGES